LLPKKPSGFEEPDEIMLPARHTASGFRGASTLSSRVINVARRKKPDYSLE
jgi:hypothetical protein